MKSLKQTIALISIAVFILSCNSRPSSVLSDKEMIAVLQDIYKADGILKNDRDRYSTSKKKDALIEGVLNKHRITQAQLDASLVWYADNIDQYTTIQDTISARMQRQFDENTALLDKQYSYKLSGFDVDLPDYFVLDARNPTFRFNIDSAKLQKVGLDNYKLRFDAEGIDTTKHRLEASMYYQYRDTIVIDKRKLLENTIYEFSKPTIADSLLCKMFGYVHMVMATEDMPKVILNNITNMDVKITANPDSTTLVDDKAQLRSNFNY